MNLYGNGSKKDSELNLRIGTGDGFSYAEIQQLQKDGLLEDFDSFEVSSKCFDKVCVYYFQGEYFLITNSNKVRLIDGSLLANRTMVVASRCITNNVQRYGQLYGTEALSKLSQDELIKLIQGEMYKPDEQLELEDITSELDER